MVDSTNWMDTLLSMQKSWVSAMNERARHDRDPLAHWQQWLQPSGRADLDAMSERWMDQGRNYFEMLQGMFKSGGDAGDLSQLAKRWLDDLGQQFKMGQIPAGAGPWGALTDQAQQMWSQLSGSSKFSSADDMMGLLGDPLRGAFERLRNMPSVGPDREKTERNQALIADMASYAEALRGYVALMAQAGSKSVERMQSLLAEREESGRRIETVRALYDLWVDASEAGYAEVALSDEYREAYGELVDSQMRVRGHLQDRVEAQCRELGMPTRSEVATIGQRLQDTRRQLRALEQRLQALEGADAPVAAAKPTAAKPAVAKPAASKPAPSRVTKAKVKPAPPAPASPIAKPGKAKPAKAASKPRVSRAKAEIKP